MSFIAFGEDYMIAVGGEPTSMQDEGSVAHEPIMTSHLPPREFHRRQLAGANLAHLLWIDPEAPEETVAIVTKLVQKAAEDLGSKGLLPTVTVEEVPIAA